MFVRPICIKKSTVAETRQKTLLNQSLSCQWPWWMDSPSVGTEAADGGAACTRMSNNTRKLAKRLIAGKKNAKNFLTICYNYLTYSVSNVISVDKIITNLSDIYNTIVFIVRLFRHLYIIMPQRDLQCSQEADAWFYHQLVLQQVGSQDHYDANVVVLMR